MRLVLPAPLSGASKAALIVAAAVAMVTGTVGCDDGGDGGTTGGSTADAVGDAGGPDVIGGGGGDGGGAVGGDWSAPPDQNAWKALFSYRGRIQGTNTDKNELWVMEPNGSGKTQLTDLKDGDGFDLSCNYGCIISPDLKWFAVVLEPPTATGFRFGIGPVGADLSVKLIKGVVFEDIIDFKFRGGRLFYTKQADCSGASCQYDLFMRELEGGGNEAVKLETFPPAFDLEGSTYTGRFRVDDQGEKVAFLNTTIRSVSVYVHYVGTGLVELDFICKFGTKGNCSGTGSEYSDTDPLAFSADGRWLVFFTFSERFQRIRLYDTDNPGDVSLTLAASVPTGSYIENACDPGNLQPWQWQRVISDPMFTPDGSEVVFLTETGCPVTDPAECGGAPPCQPKKPRTNLRRVKLSTLQTGAPLTEDDVYDLTRNPLGDRTENRRVTGFTVTPDSASVVFTATPTFDQAGNILDDGSSRQRNDREVYRMRLDATEDPEQLTNDLSWQAESPRVAPLSLFP